MNPESDLRSSASSSGSSESVRKDEENLALPSVPIPVTVKSVENAAVSLRNAVGEDVELWLMRVPKHSVLRAELLGKEISLGLGSVQDDQNGMVRRNYYFADANLSEAAKALRPLLATDGPDGPTFKIGPAFSRQVDVTFRPSIELTGTTAPARNYPRDPENLSVKYKPIGPQAALAGASSVAVYQGPLLATGRIQSKSSKPDKAVASGRVEKKKKKKKKKKKAPKSKE